MKIITLNLANYDDHLHWVLRRDMIAKKVGELKPELCLFQEVRFNKNQPSTKVTYLNMIEQIAELILRTYDQVYVVDYQIAQYYGENMEPVDYPTDIWEGVGILSMVEPDTVDTQYLRVDYPFHDTNRRINQIYGLNKDVFYVNVHFSFDSDEMFQDINETLEYIEKKFEGKDKFILIGGDMNGTPEKISDKFEEAGFVDCWELTNKDKPGYTYPSNNPISRIDYFWINNGKKDWVKNMEIIFDQTSCGIYASDHYGLMLDLE